MSIQLPGSVLSRTLRSRLIQQRLVNTGSYSLGKSLPSNAYRSHSTDTAEDTSAEFEHETLPNPPPKVENNVSPDTWRGHKEHFANRRTSKGGLSWSQHASKAEKASLTAIASNSTPDGEESISRKTLDLELKWLADPRALADRVARILQSGDVSKAAALVRQAQRDGMSCGVAWNNLIQYFMDRGCPQAAFKLYNDVSLALMSCLAGRRHASAFAMEPLLTKISPTDEEKRPNAELQNVYDHVDGLPQIPRGHPGRSQGCASRLSFDLRRELSSQAQHHPHKRDAFGLPATRRHGYVVAHCG